MTSNGGVLGMATTKVAQPTPASTTVNAFWSMVGHQAPKCAHRQHKGCRDHPLVLRVCPEATPTYTSLSLASMPEGCLVPARHLS